MASSFLFLWHFLERSKSTLLLLCFMVVPFRINSLFFQFIQQDKGAVGIYRQKIVCHFYCPNDLLLAAFSSYRMARILLLTGFDCILYFGYWHLLSRQSLYQRKTKSIYLTCEKIGNFEIFEQVFYTL